MQREVERLPKELFYLPALLLLGLVVWSQRRRQTVPAFWAGSVKDKTEPATV